jgi:hypothetical protein
MPRFPGFIFGSNSVSAFSQDQERTVNLYVERATAPGAQNPQGSLLPTPGFTAWGSGVTDTISRALFVAAGRLFGVTGGGLWEFSNTGVATRLGTVAQDSNPAQMSYNGTVGGQLGIASGGSIYSFTLSSNTFAGPHFAAVTTTMLDYAGGYGFAFETSTGKVFLSGLNDFTSWSAGQFFQRSLFPDPWQTMFVDANNLVWMIGTETFEAWYNTGTGTQPWAPLSGLSGKYGIAAPFAFSVSALGQFWLATSEDGGITPVSTKGSVPQPIGSYAVNKAFADYQRSGVISNAECFSYYDQGHTFPIWSFPTQKRTWAHDVESQSWGERGQWDSPTQDYKVWAPRTHAYAFGKHLVGDRNTGTIWHMDTAVSTDVDGLGIRRLRRTPALDTEGKRVPIDQVELWVDVGLGLVTGQGSNPQMMYRVSPDGGRTFGNQQMVSMGRMGEWGQRVVLTRLGSSPNTVLECTWSDPVPVRIADAYVNNLETPGRR